MVRAAHAVMACRAEHAVTFARNEGRFAIRGYGAAAPPL
jgi:hypothetical protein